MKTNLELILNSVGEGIYGLDNNGNITFVNKVFEAIIGWKSEEIIGKPMHPLIHHTKPDGSQYPWEQCPTCLTINEGRIFRDDNEYLIKKDGSGFFIEYVSTPIMKNDKVDGAVVIFKDITERKKAEEQIKLLAQAVRNSGDCIAITDKDYKIIFVNDSFCSTYGFLENEIIGQPIFIIHSENNLSEVSNDLFSSITKKEIWTGEVLNKRKEGNDFQVFISLSPILDDNGDVTAIIGITRDITDRKYAEAGIKKTNEELIKLNAEKDKFFSIIAHDLRSPLGGLMGLTEMMADDSQYFTPDQKKELTLNLSHSARNIFSLLENLLEWSQMQRGHTAFKPQMLGLKEVLSESSKIVNDSAKNKAIEIAVEITNEQEVFADTNMLQTVIRNLVSNAIKFTPKGGKVTISASLTENNTVLIAVKDTGIGMSNELLDNLFRIDAKNHRPGTEGELSTGLGLLLCKEFIEKHGGKIWVESEEGKGSVFYFTLPCNSE
ncbi:MAG: PAS domain-containing sensor histidine kinase [Bacteroidetes bacterium]|nr:MAG: PAS domain-containing sensor histidine kinase [Bacteroidota bacterium]